MNLPAKKAAKKAASARPRKVSVDDLKESLEGDLVQIADLRAQKEVIDTQISEVQDRITGNPYWNVAGTHDIEVVHNGFRYKAKYQQTPRRTINEEKLKRKVGPNIWRRITTLTLDRKKAEALVADGTIDPVDYADCVEETLSAPFVKVTTK